MTDKTFTDSLHTLTGRLDQASNRLKSGGVSKNAEHLNGKIDPEFITELGQQLKALIDTMIMADDHARRCDNETCEWCDYDSSDVDYGDFEYA